MKTIQLTTTKEMVVFGNKESEAEFLVSDLIKTACNFPVPGGYTASDMIDRVRILDILDIAEKANVPENTKVRIFELEDADFSNLGKYVKATKWNVVSRAIIDFTKLFDTK